MRTLEPWQEKFIALAISKAMHSNPFQVFDYSDYPGDGDPWQVRDNSQRGKTVATAKTRAEISELYQEHLCAYVAKVAFDAVLAIYDPPADPAIIEANPYFRTLTEEGKADLLKKLMGATNG